MSSDLSSAMGAMTTGSNSASVDPVTLIDPKGDVVLVISNPSYPICSFRVDSKLLQRVSRYFSNLLDPSKFSEGRKFKEDLETLNGKYDKTEDIPTAELPTIHIEDVGRIGKVQSIGPLMADFFYLIHGKMKNLAKPQLPLANLANLVVVADRFDALAVAKQFLFSKLPIPERRQKVWSEERCRMRILVGLLLEYHPWVQETYDIIINGSALWNEDVDLSQYRAMWWDLPRGVEG